MNSHKLDRMIGMAMRAGRLDIGEGRVQERIRRGQSRLVILAGDAGENTGKKFKNMCRYRSLPLISIGDRAVLGQWIGRPFVVVISVSDAGFAEQILALYAEACGHAERND